MIENRDRGPALAGGSFRARRYRDRGVPTPAPVPLPPVALDDARGHGALATKADLVALETRLTVRFYGALLAIAAAMIAATGAFTKL